MDSVITIDRFNKLMGQETRHPLVRLADLSDDRLQKNLRMPCDFYALICQQNSDKKQTTLRLVNPGKQFEIPSAVNRVAKNYMGVLFHPDLLCDTPLENSINHYPTHCCSHSALTEQEKQTISDCLQKIGKELHHAIDRHSSTIIVFHIGLLRNYCTRFCSNQK